MNEYEAKVEKYLQDACEAEQVGNKELAERAFKFAAFYEARGLNVDSKEYIASCCPVY